MEVADLMFCSVLGKNEKKKRKMVESKQILLFVLFTFLEEEEPLNLCSLNLC